MRRQQRRPTKIVLRIVLTLDSLGHLRQKFSKPRLAKLSTAVSATHVETRNTAAVPSVGGCLTVQQSSIMLRNSLFQNCSAQYGGGLGAQDSNVVILNTVFSQNSAFSNSDVRGGGSYLFNCSVVLVNVTASQNLVSSTGGYFSNGGGLYFEQSSPVVLRLVTGISFHRIFFIGFFPTAVGNTISGYYGVGGGYYLSDCTNVSVQSSSGLSLTLVLSHLDMGQPHTTPSREVMVGVVDIIWAVAPTSACSRPQVSCSHFVLSPRFDSRTQHHFGKRLRRRIFFVRLRRRQRAVVLRSLALPLFFLLRFGQPHTIPSREVAVEVEDII